MTETVTRLEFFLTRPARKQGGDRYEADFEGEPKPITFYFPQGISRPDGRTPLPSLVVSVEEG